MKIPYSRQTIEADDVEAVSAALVAPLITQGTSVPKFEEEFSRFVGARFSSACSSGTAALILAYKSLDIGPGSLVWTVPNSFVATANAALNCGAEVDFVDIDPFTWNISIAQLKEKLFNARKQGRTPTLVAPVHFSGLSCDMESIAGLAKEFNFKVVEDAAHALGARYQNQLVGNCRFSDAAIFSFHPVKTITTGEGGMVVTNNESVAKNLNLFRTHGITKDRLLLSTIPEGEWYYEQIELGWHFRLTDIQAALGVSQLQKVERFCSARANIVQRYLSAFKGTDLQVRDWPTLKNSAHHLFVVHLSSNSDRRAEIFAALRQKEIGVQVHYIPIHFHPYYRKLGFSKGMFPNAESYYEGALSLPVYPSLSVEEQDFVINTLINLL